MAVRFGHQIPLKAQRVFTSAELQDLTRRLQAMDPHIRTVVPIKGFDQAVKPGDRLIVTLRDQDTMGRQARFVQHRQQNGLPLPDGLHPAFFDLHKGTQTLQPPIVAEIKPDPPKTKWQKMAAAWQTVMGKATPAIWRTRYYAEGSTLWELAANTVAGVQNTLLDAEVDSRIGVSIDWPTRPLPYEWRGFLMKPAMLHYPLHHNERLTDARFWPDVVPGNRQIMTGSYPVDTYQDTSRVGHNAFNHAYPYVHEAFMPPVDKKPEQVNLNHQPDTYQPPGAWLTLKAEKPINVFNLLKFLGQQIRHHRNPLVHANGVEGLPLDSPTLPKGHTLRLYVGNYAGVNWPHLSSELQTHIPRLGKAIKHLGLSIQGMVQADTPYPRYDSDDPAAYQALRHRLLDATAP